MTAPVATVATRAIVTQFVNSWSFNKDLAAIAGHINTRTQLGGIYTTTRQVIVLDGTVVIGSD